MGAAEFTVLVVVSRLAFRRPPPGGHHALRRRGFAQAEWRAVGAAAAGVLAAVATGWLLFGPGWLPWWACLVLAFLAGEGGERLADR